MKTEDLHDAIGMVDAKLIEEVDAVRQAPKITNKRKLTKYVSVAACVCLVLGACVLFALLPQLLKGDSLKLPEYAVEDKYPQDSEAIANDSVGFEDEHISENTDEKNEKPSLQDQTGNDTNVLLLNSKDLTADLIKNEFSPDLISPVLYSKTVSDFSVKLFKETSKGIGNEVISPLSALYAMSMSALGADGETLAQIENAVGMTRDEMKSFLYSYMESLPTGEKYSLSIANSAWIMDDDSLTVDDGYLTEISNYLKV